MDQHLEVGDLYMEYRRETLCDYCSRCPRGIQVEITPVPRSFPDISQAQSFHYCKFNETPNETEGKPRPVDDYQPRVQLRNLFNKGLISSNI